MKQRVCRTDVCLDHRGHKDHSAQVSDCSVAKKWFAASEKLRATYVWPCHTFPLGFWHATSCAYCSVACSWDTLPWHLRHDDPKMCQTEMNVHAQVQQTWQIRAELGLPNPDRRGTTHLMLCRSTVILWGCWTVTRRYVQPDWCFPRSERGTSWRAPFLATAVAAGLQWGHLAFPTPWHLLLAWTHQSHGQIFKKWVEHQMPPRQCSVTEREDISRETQITKIILMLQESETSTASGTRQMNPGRVEVSSLGIRHVMSTEFLTMFEAVKITAEFFCTSSDREYIGWVLFFFPSYEFIY